MVPELIALRKAAALSAGLCSFTKSLSPRSASFRALAGTAKSPTKTVASRVEVSAKAGASFCVVSFDGSVAA